MNEATITNLKTFLVDVITLQINGVREEIKKLDKKIDAVEARLNKKIDAVDKKLSARIDRLDAKIDTVESRLTLKIDNLSAYIGDALEKSNNEMHKQMHDHENRITKLEAKPA